MKFTGQAIIPGDFAATAATRATREKSIFDPPIDDLKTGCTSSQCYYEIYIELHLNCCHFFFKGTKDKEHFI